MQFVAERDTAGVVVVGGLLFEGGRNRDGGGNEENKEDEPDNLHPAIVTRRGGRFKADVR